MDQYPNVGPYERSRYEQGIDAKIVIMGNTGVGKTSLLLRYTQNKFDPKNTTSTTGASFVTKKVSVDGFKVRLQLWDTAGQERFRSMAPMYYRGANAALLLYDITNVSSFDDVRGWLEELQRNCSPDLIIYIVGSKKDLQQCRQVTSDLARLSLHRWFPPPKPMLPPPPPPQPSTFSYIRPRFTSLTSGRSLPSPTASTPPRSSAETPPEPDPQTPRATGLKRTSTGGKRKPGPGDGLNRSKSLASSARPARYSGHFIFPVAGWNETEETSSNSLKEDDGEESDVSNEEWGLRKGMELFEVSAKDDLGIDTLFESLISAIIARKDNIEQENLIKKRDSVLLSSVAAPAWSTQTGAEDNISVTEASPSGWSCCSS